MKWQNLDELKSFRELKELERVNLPTVFSTNDCEKRINQYCIEGACGFKFNYATKSVNDQILHKLQKLSNEAELIDKYKSLLNGDYVNVGENRMVLHHLTRGQLGKDVFENGHNKRKFYQDELKKIEAFVHDVHTGGVKSPSGNKFTDVVQIGIGGSDLGPRAMYVALKNWAIYNKTEKLQAHFISNVDPDDCNSVLDSLKDRVKDTLFILVSKSGTTQETLANEKLVRQYLEKAGGMLSKQMIAVTSCSSPLASSDNYLQAFFMDNHVGGRYSSTSVCGGVVLSLAFGADVFLDFLSGAHETDKVSLNDDIFKNPPLLDALIGVYECNVLGFESTAILPYSQGLSRFPAHLQQLDMESNGKVVNRKGVAVNYKTGPVIFGEPGTNGQHSFYQLLHQGSHIIPLQFIGFENSQLKEDIIVENSSSQQKLNANLIAQIIAFSCGQQNNDLNKQFIGNRPSALLFSNELNPRTLGALLSHFENKVMFQGFLWNLNSFDQEGVQLGKILTKEVLSGKRSQIIQAYANFCKI